MSLPLKLFEKAYYLFNKLSPLETDWITERIAAVKTAMVNFYLIRWAGGYIAVDCGFGGKAIVEELKKLRVSPRRVTHLFLTHSDFDHMGGVDLFPDAQIFLSANEEQMINGKTSRRLRIIYNKRLPPGYHLLRDGDRVRVGPTVIEAISSEGHTPGSMSYLLDGRYLFVGDAFRIIDHKAKPIRAVFTMDPQKHLESIARLSLLTGVETVFTGHRGLSRDYARLMSDYRRGSR